MGELFVDTTPVGELSVDNINKFCTGVSSSRRLSSLAAPSPASGYTDAQGILTFSFATDAAGVRPIIPLKDI